MASELDLDNAIASILADSDEDDAVSKKKKNSSKKKNSKLSSSKALTSSVNDEDFYKNLSKISEKQNDDNQEDVKLTEEDAKKVAGNLADLDDLDSDLLGSLGRKTKVMSPRNKAGKDLELEKPHEVKRRTSSGSLHRKGSVTPFSGEDEIGVLDNNLMLSDDDDNEDVLSSSMNSSTSKHRKVSPNKISPGVSLDDMQDQDAKKPETTKMSKSKEINFDSDSDLPSLQNKETAVKVVKKPSSRSRKAKKTDDGDLFGDDDDLPDLDSRAKSGSSKRASALDSLMGKKSKPTVEAKKTKPASLDDFMAKVSTTSKTSPRSEIRSPVRSPTSEETFQFGGYMPSASTGRRSRGNTRADSEFGRRSVKFSDDLGLGLDDSLLKKRPSTAPSGRRNKEELNKSASSNKDKADSLGLHVDEKTGKSDEPVSKDDPAVGKDEDLSPQPSLQGSKSSASGDWLGLGDDVTEDQLNASLSTDAINHQGQVNSPESDTSSPSKMTVKPDEELTKTLDYQPGGHINKAEDKSLFPWEGGSGRRRRSASSKQQHSLDVLHPETSRTDKILEDKVHAKLVLQKTPPIETSTPVQNQAPGFGRSLAPSLPGNQQPSQVTDPVPSHIPLAQPSSQVHHGSNVDDATSARFSERQYRSELNKQSYEVELKDMMGKIHEAEKDKYKVEVEMSNIVAELETKIRRLEVENESLEQSLELGKQRSKEDVAAIENSHRIRIQTLEESQQRREMRQREETELLITKHRDAVSQLEREKSDIQAAHARKISTLESNKLSEIERLNDLHRRALDDVRSEHLAELNHLKKMKEQEISATVTAFSHTKSLQSLMEQVFNSTKQVEDLHHLVELSHKSSQQERDITMKSKDEYLTQLQDRLLKQQTVNDEERSRLQSLVAKMEVHIREQNRKFEEDKWKLTQEDSRLKSLRVSLEEERRVTREQLEAERDLLQRTKEEFLTQQRGMMMDINEERRTLALERAELSSAQRGIMNKEKQKHDDFTKFDAEQENARVRLAEDTAALNAREAQLRREHEELRREKRTFMDKQDKWSTEKEHIGKLGLEVEKRAQEIDELSLEAAKVREEGRKSLDVAQRMQVEISQQASELEARVLLLQEKERHIAEERLAAAKEKREIERCRGQCSRCAGSLGSPLQTDSKKEPAAKLSHSLESSLSAQYVTSGELVTSSSRAGSAHSLTPDLLVNTLDLKRTLRRWSQDKEQDEEFLAKESQFLNSLQDSRLSPW